MATQTSETSTPFGLSAISSMMELPLMLYSTARSAGFSLQFQLLETLAAALPSKRGYGQPQDNPLVEVKKEIVSLLRRDAQNIAAGMYPLAVLRPESPVEHMLRFPRLLADGLSLHRRREEGRTTEFTRAARELLAELPRYYRRNFHFQTDGYLSERSADLYEHQVEMLFRGTADAMRRLIIASLRERFGSTDGKGLRFLEVAAGTGRATRFVHLAFPKAKIIATDLSEPYLRRARRNLSDLHRVEFLQADAANLPFSDGRFDAVYSVFLFHELPMAARREVLAEARRVLKPEGFFGFVDSLQGGDYPSFDPLLTRFPKDFHEPFYRDYVAHPMEGLIQDAGFRDPRGSRGFFSKAVWATRTA